MATLSEYHVYLQLAIAGMAGAVIRSLLVNGNSIMLVRVWEKDGKKGVDLGIIGAMMMGAAVGVVVDQHPLAAFLGAVSGSLLIEEMAKRVKPPKAPGDS